MRNQLLDLVEHESTFGPEGHIFVKLNSLADPDMVEALYRASQAGTPRRPADPRHCACCARACRG